MAISAGQVKEAAKLAARRVGLDVRLYHPRNSVDARRARLLAEFGVATVIDVGANVGQYGTLLRATGYEERIVSFEPLHGPFEELRRRAAADGRWEAHRVALGSQSTTATMHVAAASSASSLLGPAGGHGQPAYVRAIGTEDVQVARLDDVARPLVASGGATFLKLDVQGFELEVLRGASMLLDEVAGVEAELALSAIYEGQPLYREVIDVIEGAGLRPVSFEPAYADQATGRVLQVDGIFIR